MPSPTWIGLVPPRVVVAPLAPATVCDNMSWNVIRDALNAVVFTFAMLLPTTSMNVMWFSSPAIAENIARIMRIISPFPRRSGPNLAGGLPGRVRPPDARCRYLPLCVPSG